MTLDKIKKVWVSGLIEVGSHTLTHVRLSDVPPEQAVAELKGSKSLLEKLLGAPVVSFAYPFGARTEETMHLVERQGYKNAVISGLSTQLSVEHLFDLPRKSIFESDKIAGFVRKLHER